MDYFTADPHFGHTNIIKHCARPFSSVEEMDGYILDQWNRVLTPGDRLFILGDFAGLRVKASIMTPYLDRINLNPSQIVLVLGNHDNEKECRKIFPQVHGLSLYKNRGDRSPTGASQRIMLCHYAMRTWYGSHRGVWHLYGHSHGMLVNDPDLLSIDCGVDPNAFLLLSYDEVKRIMVRKEMNRNLRRNFNPTEEGPLNEDL